MAINTGILNVGSVGGSTVDSASLDTRRMYNFSDRVADLAPEESPFFVYLSKVAKVPTDDPTFRFLENRTKVSWTDRSFLLQGSCVFPAAGSSISCTVDTSGGASVDWLVKGMVFAVEYNESSSPETIIARVETGPVDNGSDTTFTAKTISSVDGSETGADNAKCTVIGTSYAEGSGSPDVWSEGLDDDYGYTQIFKTAAEMSNTSIATRYRGYENEWQRIWNLKLREHKVDIERAMLFGQRASVSSINYSEGIVGHIVKNATANIDDSALSYTSGAPYFRSSAAAEFTYDRLLSDFEVVYDPARGGSSNKLALASLPVITYFNKFGGTFLDQTVNAGNVENFARYNIAEKQGNFGHSIMEVNTVHGTMSLVKEPLFRGFADSYLCLCDMSNIAYRPLVGNGLNRDTSITTNVQQADEDLRKDLILTEAGLEVALPESHFLINIEGAT
jgi:hypothetical protein